MVINYDEIKEDLEIYGINFKETNFIKSKCVEICESYELTGEQFAVQWLSFAASHDCDELAEQYLEEFEKSFISQKKKKTSEIIDSPQNDVKSISLHHCDEDLLAAYNASPSTSSKNVDQTSSRGSASKRTLLTQSFENALNSSLAPSLSQSPQSQHSQRYSERTNAGVVVASYGTGTDAKEWPSSGVAGRCEVKQVPGAGGDMLTGSFKFMFEKLRDSAEVLDEAVFECGRKILECRPEIEEFSRLRTLTNNSLWFLGRICCDSVGKLNAASVMLQGDREFGGSEVVRLDLSQLASYSLFPGQVVALKGINSSGDCIVAQDILSGFVKVQPKPNLPDALDGFEVQIACGPFTTMDNLLYEPLNDLLKGVMANPPQVLILLGPLLDSSHPSLDETILEDSYDSILARILGKIETALDGMQTKVYFVTSCRDICCFPVYPTPPAFFGTMKTSGLVSLLPDPCLLDINGVAFGITSVDFPMHISREEINFMSKTTDRLARLSEHMLLQQSFYPVYPPPEGIPLNLEKADMYSRLPFTPHVMVTPSDLKGYVKDVSGCLFVNPERLVKGKSGGSFCRLRVEGGKGDRPDVKAQILKI